MKLKLKSKDFNKLKIENCYLLSDIMNILEIDTFFENCNLFLQQVFKKMSCGKIKTIFIKEIN